MAALQNSEYWKFLNVYRPHGNHAVYEAYSRHSCRRVCHIAFSVEVELGEDPTATSSLPLDDGSLGTFCLSVE